MTPLSAADALALWEQGRARHPVDRALLLYAAAAPQLPAPALADVPIGRRDAALRAWRQASFGARLEALADCPHCGERLAFTLDLAALAADDVAAPDVEVDGARYRRPTSRDLAAVARDPDAATAAGRLLQRCRLPGGPPGEASPERVDAALAAADAAADVSLALACEACGARFEADLDIAALLWQDVDALARRALLDVDLLARAYGWSERDILALPDARRAAYVELAAR